MTMAATGTASPLGGFVAERRKATPRESPCWLCGVVGRHRDDPHYRAGRLCAACWAAQPSAYDRAARSASALRVALHLGRVSPAQTQLVRDLAGQLRIQAWADSGTEPNEKRFGHLDTLALVEALNQLGETDPIVLGAADGRGETS